MGLRCNFQVLNNSFFSFFNFLLGEQYSIRESSRSTRVAEKQVALKQTQSRAKSKRVLNANSLNNSFICFSTNYLESIKKHIIIRKFYRSFLLNNTNEKSNISEEFIPFFSSEIQIKRGLFFKSFFFFSLKEYKQKERNYQEVFLSFLFDNSNKSLALTGNVFKVVSLPNMLMRDYILIKTPAELPPPRRVGKVCVRLFSKSFSFEPVKIKEKQCCFIFLVYEKQHYSNKTVVESLVQPFVHFLTSECKSTTMMDDGRIEAAYTLISCIFNRDNILLFFECDERSILRGKKNKGQEVQTSLLENILFEHFAQMLYFFPSRKKRATSTKKLKN